VGVATAACRSFETRRPDYALVLFVALSGCIRSGTNVLRVGDPSAVALFSETAGGPTEVLPADREPREAVLGEGTFAPEPGSVTGYRVRAFRTDGGAIELEWDTRAPILNGERRNLLASRLIAR
jgi:hypothetical protein